MARLNGNGVDIRALARQGAEARMAELDAEIAALRKLFPELAILAAGSDSARAVEPSPAPNKARTMNAAQRAAVSKRMKKYWRQRRAQRALEA
jgi:hypothetical protein